MTRRDAVLLVFLGAVWGAVYPLTSLVLRELSPPAVVAARTALGALLLLPLAVRRGALAGVRERAGALVVAALLQATVPLVLLTTGQQHVAAGLAGILVGSQPVWATLLTVAAERTIHPRELLGILVGMLGVALLFVRDLDATGTSMWGGGLLLAAAFFYGAGSVYIHRRLPDVSPLVTATAAMTVSAAALAPFAVTAVPPLPDAATTGWLIVLGVGATGAAQVLFYALIQQVGAVRANLAAYFAPGFAVAYGAGFLHDRITAAALGGLVLITAGSLLAAPPRQESPTSPR